MRGKAAAASSPSYDGSEAGHDKSTLQHQVKPSLHGVALTLTPAPTLTPTPISTSASTSISTCSRNPTPIPR